MNEKNAFIILREVGLGRGLPEYKPTLEATLYFPNQMVGLPEWCLIAYFQKPSAQTCCDLPTDLCRLEGHLSPWREILKSLQTRVRVLMPQEFLQGFWEVPTFIEDNGVVILLG
jgi:hypothetical protein